MAPLDKNLISKIKTGNVVDVRNYKESVLSENVKKREINQRIINRDSASNKSLQLKRTEAKLPVMRFPEDLGIYYIGFEFSKYEKPNFKTKAKSLITAHCALPIPAALVDPLQARWEEEEVGLLGYAVDAYQESGSIKGAFNKINNELQSAASGDTTSALTTLGQLIQAVGSRLNNQIGSAINLAKQHQGLAFNPYLAFFYNGPSFKKHRFTWRLAPRRPEESEIIKEIVRLFHYHQSPTLSPIGIFFNYPSIVTPKIYTNDEGNTKYLHDFKPCVIESCIVNYAPNGIPSFFSGTRAPTEIEIELNLSEIALWLRDDYEEKK